MTSAEAIAAEIIAMAEEDQRMRRASAEAGGSWDAAVDRRDLDAKVPA